VKCGIAELDVRSIAVALQLKAMPTDGLSVCLLIDTLWGLL